MSFVSKNPLLLAYAQQEAAGGISRSLRFNSSDSAYLSRTPASAGNRRTWTFSAWIKRCALSPQTGLFAAGTDLNNLSTIYLGSNGTIWYYDYVGGATRNQLSTTSVYRDFSAWMHVLVAVNTTQATEANRVRIYVNGAEVTAFSTATYPSQNADTFINSTGTHTINKESDFYANYGNMYVADAYFIDGQQLTPSSFTETDATTGQLIPKAYTGSYGTNGFHLEFADNSSNTATTLGKDTSGNGNNWTPNNLSVTAGAGNDSLVDVPTNGAQTDTGVGGEVRGNYCTFNPLQLGSGGSLANGNLDMTSSISTYSQARGTFGISTGKFYWEITVNTGGTGDAIGIISTSNFSVTDDPGYYSNGYSYMFNGNKRNNASASAYGSSYTTGDVIGVAFDMDNGTLAFYKNGTSPGTAFSSLSGSFYPVIGTSGSNAMNMTANFGQRPFAYTAPSGFKALCTANLAAPLVTKPSTVMDVKLYTGTGSSQSITGLGFNPDFVWIKNRSSSGSSHALFDVVRGADNRLRSNGTDAELSPAIYGTLSSFDSAGFTVAPGSSDSIETSTSGSTYVAWTWDAGSSTVTNTQGSITSSVRANATAGFSVVAFNSGSGAPTDYTVGHGLNVAPQFIIAKSRTSSSFSWVVYHTSIATTTKKYLSINSTAATSDNGTNIWGAAQPTSTVFGITSGNGVVANTDCIAYCFAPVVGYSNAFSYTGNGSSDGPMVYLGFRPRLILLKASSAAYGWSLIDTARDTYNVATKSLVPNESVEEQNLSSGALDVLSNGFKLRFNYLGTNSSGVTYIGYAWAESPFNYARAR